MVKGIGERADNNVNAGGPKRFDFVGQPLPAAGTGHGGEATRTGAVDDEQGRFHGRSSRRRRVTKYDTYSRPRSWFQLSVCCRGTSVRCAQSG